MFAPLFKFITGAALAIVAIVGYLFSGVMPPPQPAPKPSTTTSTTAVTPPPSAQPSTEPSSTPQPAPSSPAQQPEPSTPASSVPAPAPSTPPSVEPEPTPQPPAVNAPRLGSVGSLTVDCQARTARVYGRYEGEPGTYNLAYENEGFEYSSRELKYGDIIDFSREFDPTPPNSDRIVFKIYSADGTVALSTVEALYICTPMQKITER